MIEILKYLPLLLKYLPAILKGRDVSDKYLADQGTEKPAIISRRFVGMATLVIASGLGAASIYFNVSIPDENIQGIINSTMQVIAAGASIYGAILTIIGEINQKKKTANGE